MIRSGPSDRTRLDEALVHRGLAVSRSRARALILAGDVLVNGAPVSRAGFLVSDRDTVGMTVKPRYVSRGGEKLAHALTSFGLNVGGKVAADLGASTGGFTDCLLQAGATRVYAVDVGYGQLHDRIRQDERVIVLERTNARTLDPLPEKVELVVIDVSFISLRLIFPTAARLLQGDGICIPLIKPQFEAGKGEVGRGGVVRDPGIHRRVLQEVCETAREAGFGVEALVASPLLGPAGNREFLALLEAGRESRPITDMMDLVVPRSEGEAQ